MNQAFWSQRGGDPAFATKILIMIEDLMLGNVGVPRIIDSFPEAFRGGVQWSLYEKTFTTGKTLYFDVGEGEVENFGVVLFGGTEQTQNLLNMIRGWTEPNFNIVGGESPPFRDAATTTILQNGPFWTQNRPLYLFGHSYGGATATVVAARLNRVLRRNNVRLTTFGSPRPGTSELRAWLHTTRLTRWFVDADPVPQIPPHDDEAPALAALWRITGGQQGNITVQPDDNGIVVHTDGTFGSAQHWPSTGPSFALSLASWLTGTEAFASNLHGLPEYRRRINLGADDGGHPSLQPSAVERPDEPFVPTPAEERMLSVQVENIVRNAAALPQALPSIVPGSPMPRVIARKLGKFWFVLQDGNIIASGPGKRHAKKLAREYRRSLTAAHS